MLIFVISRIYFWGDYNIELFFGQGGENDVAIASAVDRSILLNENHDLYPIILFLINDGPVPACSNSDIAEGGINIYKRCRVVWPGNLSRCKEFMYDPGCRAIRVSEQNWKEKIIREQIIYSALHPCDFLIKADEVDSFLQNWVDSGNQDRSSQLYYNNLGSSGHKRYWYAAGCEKQAVNKVYIEICDETKNKSLTKCNVIDVYKVAL